MVKKMKEEPARIRNVKRVLEGGETITKVSISASVPTATLLEWIDIYTNFGEEGLLASHSNKRYSVEVKFNAVQDYLSGEGSLLMICNKYNISGKSVLRGWIKQYNEGKLLNSSKSGDDYMNNKKKKNSKSLRTRDDYEKRMKELEQKNEDLEIENALLKKLQEIERRHPKI
ncbi:transposase [Macrococcoides canis]|uniref:transposase n=1 Tax=Macrococcoides canis TaxID=1855823 RepID=UPI001F298BFC|nr:transposase [Macrococcus canis]UJS27434.1 transposase [Macrococcus canis]UTG99375.1 transposase [Macrococcus canis]UTG99706.1 transposase [Macrococcus canis]UTH00744.1 transposase [Macrococcus canis]UTH08873.1 transposase [Macrococcus canis]